MMAKHCEKIFKTKFRRLFFCLRIYRFDRLKDWNQVSQQWDSNQSRAVLFTVSTSQTLSLVLVDIIVDDASKIIKMKFMCCCRCDRYNLECSEILCGLNLFKGLDEPVFEKLLLDIKHVSNVNMLFYSLLNTLTQ